MGGRGSSSSGGGIGGGAGGSLGTAGFNPAEVQMPSVQDILKGNITPKGGVEFNKFMKMTDDEKADVIADALKVKPPAFLDDSGLQRVAYFTGLSETPEMVSDAALDKMPGKSLYRTVNDSYNRSTDIGYTSGDIYNQVATGNYTQYSDSGGSAYGKAIYFADNYRESSYYGQAGKNPKTMRAKYKPDANVLTTQQLSSLVAKERAGNTKLYRAASLGGSSRDHIIALAKGYHAVQDSGYSGYNMVLNRGGLAMSTTVKNTKIGGSKW